MVIAANDTVSANIFSDNLTRSNNEFTENETISADIYTGDSVMQFPGTGILLNENGEPILNENGEFILV